MAKKVKKRIIGIIGVIIAAIIGFLGRRFITILEPKPEEVALYGVVTPYEVQLNNKFTIYIGKNKSLDQVRALVNVVIANNIANKEIVSINNINTNEELIKMRNALADKKYNIETEYNYEGIINNIIVTEAKE